MPHAFTRSAHGALHASRPRGGTAVYLKLIFCPQMNLIFLTALCGSCVLSWPEDDTAATDDGGLPADTLRTVEVTALRSIYGLAAAVPVQRIDSAAIRQRGITDTGDALRRLAGVNVRDYGGAGGLKTVSVRGLGAAHTTVTYDGLCTGDTRQGQTDLQRYSIDRLAGLELHTLDNAQLLLPVRNLGAAVLDLLGTAAATPRQGTHGTAALRQASFGQWNPSAGISQSIGQQMTVSAAADWMKADNDYPFTVKNGVASGRLHRTNSLMRTGTAEADLLHLTADSRLTAKVFFHRNRRHLPGQVILYVNDNNERLTEQETFGQMHYSWQKGKRNAFAAAKYDGRRTLYDNISPQYPGGTLSQHYRQHEAYVTTGAAIAPLPLLSLAYATDYIHATMTSNLPADRRVSRDTWLQSLSARVGAERWNVTVRGIFHFSHDHRSGGNDAARHTRLSPSVAASVRVFDAPVRLHVRVGWKESFRLPTFTECYFYHLGEVSLRPETARQTNAGLTLQAAFPSAALDLALTADAYLTRVADRIVSVPYNLFIWRTVNMGCVRTAGTDVTLSVRWRPAARHRLLFSANYTLQRAADRTVRGSDTYGNQLAYTPLHSGGASLFWENPWISLVVHTTFASCRWSTSEHLPTTRLPAYSEWGFSASRSFRLGRKRSDAPRLDLRADLINAFGKDYEIIRRYPMPLRAYKLCIALTF